MGQMKNAYDFFENSKKKYHLVKLRLLREQKT
jgi:hypothetical protein